MILFFLIFISYSQGSLIEKFEAFQVKFNKQYEDKAEYALRLNLFNQSLYQAEQLNIDNAPYSTFGITKFSDRTADEIVQFKNPLPFRKKLQNLKKKKKDDRRDLSGHPHPKTWEGECKACVRFPRLADGNVPSEWDWRLTSHDPAGCGNMDNDECNQDNSCNLERSGCVAVGPVTPVKNQGVCGDCYAFSAVGDMESAWYLNNNPLEELSVQQITSCDRNGFDSGCRGDMTTLDTFAYVETVGGIVSWDQYPYDSMYKAKLATKCDESKLSDWAAQFSDYGIQISGAYYPVDEDKTKNALYHLGPLSIAINADYLQMYTHGISRPRECSTQLDHAVLLVGYGVEHSNGQNTPYWTVKNSWGSDWGEHGYFRLFRGDNTCGVVSDVTHSVV